MAQLHQATFKWPAGPKTVIVTGTFDGWSRSVHLTKSDSGFSTTIGLPWGEKTTYKYIVDGTWAASPHEPQESDNHGNYNNVYTSPPKPPTTSTEPSSAPTYTATSETAATKVEEVAKSAAATSGTSSFVSYVTSGIGAAIATVTGIDPINPAQIPVEDAKTAKSTVPAPDATKAEPAPTIATASDPAHVESKNDKPLVDALAPIADEPVVLKLASAVGITPESKTVPEEIKNAPKAISVPGAVEPYKETNGVLPAEVASAATETKPAEAVAVTVPSTVLPANVVAAAKTDAPAERPSGESTSTAPTKSKINGKSTPPNSPRKKSFQGSEAASSVTDSPTKRRKRDSIIGKLKDVFGSPGKTKKEKRVSSP